MKLARSQRETLDARALGAKCDHCPLNHRQPVPPQVRASKLVILNESPTADEDATGKILTGREGRWLTQQMKHVGVDTQATHVTNAVLCYPTHKMKPEAMKLAVACCAPRLKAEIGTGRTIFSAGEFAYQAVAHAGRKFSKWRGAIQELHGNTVVPYYSVNYSQFWLPWHADNFVRMLNVAHHAANGDVEVVKWPAEILYPGREAASAIRQLMKAGLPIGLDIENRFDGTITAIGVANKHGGVCLPWESYTASNTAVRGITEYDGGQECRDLLIDLIEDPTVFKVLQNGTHDQIYLLRKGIYLRGFIRDTMLESVAVRHKLPHDLQYIVAMEFPVTPWKAEFKEGDLNKTSDDLNDLPEEELRRYCLRDSYATVLVDEALWAQLQEMDRAGGTTRYTDKHRNLHLKAQIGMQMRYFGWPVNHAAVAEHLERHKAKMIEAGARATEITQKCGFPEYLIAQAEKAPKVTKKPRKPKAIPPFNPGSGQQVAQVIYGLFQIPISHRTDNDGPSTNDKALTAVLDWGGEKRDFARAILDYRENQKICSSYLNNIPKASRIHPIWKPHVPLTERWAAGLESSSRRGFSVQTIPKHLRNIFIAEEGCWLLSADYSQLELRMIALLAGDLDLINAYAAGGDIHLKNARELFNKPLLDKATEEGARLRDNAKIVFGFNYGVAVHSAWERLRANGIEISERMVGMIHQRWFELHQPITTWQHATFAAAKKNRFIDMPFSNTRIELFGDMDKDLAITDTSNYPVQNSGANVMDPAMIGIAHEIGWTQDRHIVAQVHDELVVNTNLPSKDARIMARNMTTVKSFNGHRMEFPVEFKLGKNWGKFHKVKNPEGCKEMSLQEICTMFD